MQSAAAGKDPLDTPSLRAPDSGAFPADPTPRRTSRRRRQGSRRPGRLIALVAASALVLAACGSGAATPSASTAPATGSPAPTATPTPALAADGLGQLEQDYERVVKRVSPSVVVIQTDSGLGSGIIFDTAGHIVTNAHVVGSATSFTVTLADGRQLQGSLVGTFVGNDVAVIKVDATDLQPATFADSSKLQVGQIVMAVGNPLGLQSSVTQGIVSSVGRTVAEPGGAALPGLIQTSAAINPGNSGGALVDIHGDVVGIPTLAATDPQMGGSAPGIGFAIPSNDAVDFANQMIQNGKVVDSHRAYLGIRSASAMGAPGVLVYAVETGGPADQAGVRPGQLLISVDGHDTPDNGTLATVLAGLKPGQTVPLVLMSRDGTQSTVQVTLGELPG